MAGQLPLVGCIKEQSHTQQVVATGPVVLVSHQLILFTMTQMASAIW